MSRYHWTVEPTATVRVQVSNLLHERRPGGRPDRPRRYDALAHVVAADLDAIEAPDVDVETLELVAKLHAAIATLPDRVRVVVEARLDGATLREAGRLIGVSGQRAAQIEREATCDLQHTRHGITRLVQVEELDLWGGTWRAWRVVPA